MVGYQFEEYDENSGYDKCPSLLAFNFVLNCFKEKSFFYIICIIAVVLGFLYLCHIIWIFIEKLFGPVVLELCGRIYSFQKNYGNQNQGSRNGRGRGRRQNGSGAYNKKIEII